MSKLLTASLVLDLRHRYAAGSSLAALSAGLPVDRSTIQAAVSGTTWRHLPVPVKTKKSHHGAPSTVAANPTNVPLTERETTP